MPSLCAFAACTALPTHGAPPRARAPRRAPPRAAARFRPCIDLHEGRVKQLVGGTLGASGGTQTNFASDEPAAAFAARYRDDDLPGGHVIMLGPGNGGAALDALGAYPGGMQAGGGVNPGNAGGLLDAGASHVIVTSYVFRGGVVDWDRVREMERAVGRGRLVLDVSCRRREGEWVVCTDRWQKWTDVVLGQEAVGRLGDVCDELLVHAVDVEGRRAGMDEELVARLADWATVPITYAGGVRSVGDMDRAHEVGRGLVDVTVGSALDIFGGAMKYDDAVAWQRAQEAKG